MDQTEIYVVCDPDGPPMRAFEHEAAANAWRFAQKLHQPAAKFGVVKIVLHGPVDMASTPDPDRFPSLHKIHVILNKNREPYSAWVLYDHARNVKEAKGYTRAPLILDRSEVDE